MTLTDIENEFNFKYSALYKKLEQDGMLDIGEYGPNWYTDVFPKLKNNPTLHLHTNDFELIKIDEIANSIKRITDPKNYIQLNLTYKFIPFGQSGAGDHFCFFLNEQNGDDIPIVLLWHDSYEVDCLAKNLQDYIFKVLLTDMSSQDTYNNVRDEEFRDNIKSTLKTHSKYLTVQQTEILQNVVAREIIDYEIELLRGRKEKRRGLLAGTELDEVLKKVIPYEKMGETFDYLLPQKIEKITEANKRRVGTLSIKVQPVPPKQDKIYSHLKALNWRQVKQSEPNAVAFFRKHSVIFGVPSMATIDETFREKLLKLSSISKNIEIQFQEDDTGIIYIL